MSSYLVLGSNSFSGAHCVSRLLAEGGEVIGVSRSEEPAAAFLPYANQNRSQYTFHRFDLNQDLDGIIALIGKRKPRYIINFAAQSMVGESWQHPEQWFMTNTVSAIRLHDALRHFDWLEKFVQISTPEVYGDCSETMRESIHYLPSTPYAVSKAAADMSLMTFVDQYDFPVVFTRAANVYGPSQQLYRIIPKAILRFLTGGKLQLHGGGLSVRSFIDIRDVVEGTLKVMHGAESGEIFHLSTKRYISIYELVTMIAQQIGISIEEHVEVVGDRPGKDQAYILDSSKARTQLNWEDRISLEQGIADTIEWVKDNLDFLQSQPTEYIHQA